MPRKKVITIIKYITVVNVGRGDLEVTWKEENISFFVKKEHYRNSCQGQTRIGNGIIIMNIYPTHVNK